MSIEQKTDEHGQLFRWACLVCSTRGVWVREEEQAKRGVRAHIAGRRHLHRQRQLAGRGDVGPAFEVVRDDIASGNVWPEGLAEDPHYIDFLERRVRELEAQLARAEEILDRYNDFSERALTGLDEVVDEVVARLIAEEHGPPPKPWHPSSRGGEADATA